MKRIKVSLSDAEIDFAKRWAHKRESPTKKKIKDKIKSRKHSHFVGLLGELAFGKWSHQDIDIRLFEVVGDGGVDFCIDGVTIDVKTASYDPPILKYNRLIEVKCDRSVLTLTTNYRDIFLCGWCNRKWFLEQHEIKNFGWGNKVVLPEKKLCSLEEWSGL